MFTNREHKGLMNSIAWFSTALLALALAIPDLAAQEYLGMKPGQCRTQVVFVEYYNQPGSNPDLAEYIAYRESAGALFLILEFLKDSKEPPITVYLLNPGSQPSIIGFEALKQRYPSPCDIIDMETT